MYLVINKCVTAVKVSNFSGHYLRNRSTLDIGVLGYIGIVQHKEHSPEVFSIPPGTLCISPAVATKKLWIWIHFDACMCFVLCFPVQKGILGILSNVYKQNFGADKPEALDLQYKDIHREKSYKRCFWGGGCRKYLLTGHCWKLHYVYHSTVYGDVTPRSLIERKRFGETYCLLLQGRNLATKSHNRTD